MLSWLKQNRFVVVAVGCGFALLWLYFSSESFVSCVEAKQNADAEKIFYESASDFLITLRVWRGCTGYFFDQAGPAITALATILIAIFTWTLWRTSAAQAHLTVIAIEDARIASQRELRAYVSALPKTAFIAHGDTFAVIVCAENTGNTPAFNTVCNWQLDIGLKPGKTEFQFNLVNPDSGPIPTFVLYPKGMNVSVREYKLTTEDLKNLEAGTHVIRAYGQVTYTDAFSAPQIGEFFCYMDIDGYRLWLGNYGVQPMNERRPVTAPFKFTQFNNRASFN